MLHIVRADLSNTWALMYNEGNIKYKEIGRAHV